MKLDISLGWPLSYLESRPVGPLLRDFQHGEATIELLHLGLKVVNGASELLD